MNIKLQGNFIPGISTSPLAAGGMLKSTQEKLARQGERDHKIAFFEQQKENLKNIRTDDLEGISRKLDMLHSYEDQIMEARISYNQEQMKHIMDEAMERAEKMAEAAEKMEPKTPEERQEEMVEEALGIDESKGELTETMEELTELTEDITEELTEEITEELTEQLPKELSGDITEQVSEELNGEMSEKLSEAAPEEAAAGELPENAVPEGQRYRRLDLYI